MVEIAARRHPAVAFVQASVTALPFADGSFDGAVGNIMIQHVGEPERAAKLRECSCRADAWRCRRGTYPRRSPFFAALLGAIAEAEVPPPSENAIRPVLFQFADDAAFDALLQGSGFANVEIDTISLDLPVQSADDLIAALSDGTVPRGLLRAADDSQRRRIRESLEARLAWRRHETYVVPASVKIASGTRHTGDDDLAYSMVSQHVADGGRGVTQRVDLLDDDLDVAGLEERGESCEVLAVHNTVDEVHVGRAFPHQVLHAPFLSSPQNKPPVFPTLFGMNVPVGANTRAVADGGWFITLSRMTS